MLEWLWTSTVLTEWCTISNRPLGCFASGRKLWCDFLLCADAWAALRQYSFCLCMYSEQELWWIVNPFESANERSQGFPHLKNLSMDKRATQSSMMANKSHFGMHMSSKHCCCDCESGGWALSKYAVHNTYVGTLPPKPQDCASYYSDTQIRLKNIYIVLEMFCAVIHDWRSTAWKVASP